MYVYTLQYLVNDFTVIQRFQYEIVRILLQQLLQTKSNNFKALQKIFDFIQYLKLFYTPLDIAIIIRRRQGNKHSLLIKDETRKQSFINVIVIEIMLFGDHCVCIRKKLFSKRERERGR